MILLNWRTVLCVVFCARMNTSAHIKKGLYGLGVFSDGKHVYLLYTQSKHPREFRIDASDDGDTFYTFKKKCQIRDENNQIIPINTCSFIRPTCIEGTYYLIFCIESIDDTFFIASSTNFSTWKVKGKIHHPNANAPLVLSKLKYNGQYVIYWGNDQTDVALSYDLLTWTIDSSFTIRYDRTPQLSSIILGDTVITSQGVILFYNVKESSATSSYMIQAVMLDNCDPHRVIYQFHNPCWDTPSDWKYDDIRFIGIISINDTLLSYWDRKGNIVTVHHGPIEHLVPSKGARFWESLRLNKLIHNPILRPIISHIWESKATFNPAAIYDNGKVHLIYRAIGDNDQSVLGYASSSDGVHIDERLTDPIFVPNLPTGHDPHTNHFLSLYMSGGGGYGGCEDPRITRIGNTYYMTYVAYDGWSPPRVALTSIDASDFQNHRWNWKAAVLISPPGVVDKNACLLPEKIGGRFVIFHRIFPNILVDFVDDLSFDGKSQFLRGEYAIAPRRNYWDSRKVGVGPPPMKTDDGWLLIYHAVDDKDDGKYKMGAMLLDLTDPTRVLYRSHQPILEPTHWYENEGFKAGVAYPCGAVIKDNELIVYYGGADMVSCAAWANLPTFINQLKYNEVSHLRTIDLHHSYN